MRQANEGGRARLAPLSRLIYAAAGALLVVAVAATAARPTDGAWRLYSWQKQPLVEQQTPGSATQQDPALWVTNPTGGPGDPGCVWDADDYQEVSFSGQLESGESASITLCLIADWHEHLSKATSNGDLEVTVQVGPTVATGVATACVVGPDYDHGSAQLPPVEGSNGGVGFFTDVTFTVKNTSRRKVRRGFALGYLGFRTGNDLDCNLGMRYGFDPAWRVGSG